jgi:hypothetical protein
LVRACVWHAWLTPGGARRQARREGQAEGQAGALGGRGWRRHTASTTTPCMLLGPGPVSGRGSAGALSRPACLHVSNGNRCGAINKNTESFDKATIIGFRGENASPLARYTSSFEPKKSTATSRAPHRSAQVRILDPCGLRGECATNGRVVVPHIGLRSRAHWRLIHCRLTCRGSLPAEHAQGPPRRRLEAACASQRCVGEGVSLVQAAVLCCAVMIVL